MVVIGLVMVASPSAAAQEPQWPPFNFYLTPLSYEDGRVTYSIYVSNQAEWALADFIIKIPLPPGTRHIEAVSLRDTTIPGFDGQEITFTSPIIHRAIDEVRFTLEVTDPTINPVTIQPWISWKGQQPGTYLPDPVSYDITRQPLGWRRPEAVRFQVSTSAIVANSSVTYVIYPETDSTLRVWDPVIQLKLPRGVEVIHTNPTPPFNVGLQDDRVVFSALEIPRREIFAPMTVQVQPTANTPIPLTAQAEVSWKNSGRSAGLEVPSEGRYQTSQLVISEAEVPHFIVADTTGDVAFGSYDVVAARLQEDGPYLKVDFNTAEPIGTEPTQILLYIDQDCQLNTGVQRYGRGLDLLAFYDPPNNQTSFVRYNDALGDWEWNNSSRFLAEYNDQAATMRVPYAYLDNRSQFCWVAISRYRTSQYIPNPPSDVIPDTWGSPAGEYQALQAFPQLAIEDVIVTVPTASDTDSVRADIEELEATSVATYVIPMGSEWRYFKGTRAPGTNWQQTRFNDRNWLVGPAGFGFGDMDDATPLTDMHHNYVSVYLRHPFEVADPGTITELLLEVDYDDGFIAYINGVEVARRQISAFREVQYNTPASGSHEAGQPERIDITTAIDTLVPGTNLLAIQAHNHALSSPDFTISPALLADGLTAPTAVPPPTFAGVNVLVGQEAVWSYHPGTREPLFTWKTAAFDPTQWDAAPRPDQQVDEVSIYMRHVFNVATSGQLVPLTLDVSYEGGFVAYLNGQEVARRQLKNGPIFFNTLAESHQATTEIIDISAYSTLLVPGENILAMQAHAGSIADRPVISPRLTWGLPAQ